MDDLGREFEEMLIQTKNTELINKYALLKGEIISVMDKALKAIEILEKK